MIVVRRLGYCSKTPPPSRGWTFLCWTRTLTPAHHCNASSDRAGLGVPAMPASHGAGAGCAHADPGVARRGGRVSGNDGSKCSTKAKRCRLSPPPREDDPAPSSWWRRASLLPPQAPHLHGKLTVSLRDDNYLLVHMSGQETSFWVRFLGTGQLAGDQPSSIRTVMTCWPIS